MCSSVGLLCLVRKYRFLPLGPHVGLVQLERPWHTGAGDSMHCPQPHFSLPISLAYLGGNFGSSQHIAKLRLTGSGTISSANLPALWLQETARNNYIDANSRCPKATTIPYVRDKIDWIQQCNLAAFVDATALCCETAANLSTSWGLCKNAEIKTQSREQSMSNLPQTWISMRWPHGSDHTFWQAAPHHRIGRRSGYAFRYLGERILVLAFNPGRADTD